MKKSDDLFDLSDLDDETVEKIGGKYPDMAADEADRIFGRTMAKLGGISEIPEEIGDAVTGTEPAIKHSIRGFAAMAAAVVLVIAAVPAMFFGLRRTPESPDSDTVNSLGVPSFTVVETTDPEAVTEIATEYKTEAVTAVVREDPTEASAQTETCMRPVPAGVTKPTSAAAITPKPAANTAKPNNNAVPKATTKLTTATSTAPVTTQTTAFTTAPATTTAYKGWVNDCGRYMTIKEVIKLNGMTGEQVNLTVGGCSDFYFSTDGREIINGENVMIYRLPIEDNTGSHDRFTLDLTEGPDYNYLSAILHDKANQRDYTVMGYSDAGYLIGDDIKGLAYEGDPAVMTLKDVVFLNRYATKGGTLTLDSLESYPHDYATYEVRPNSVGYRYPVADADGNTLRYYVVAEFYGGIGRGDISIMGLIDLEEYEYHDILTEDLSYLISDEEADNAT